MTPNQKKVLQLAVNHLSGVTAEINPDERRLVLSVVGKQEWPSGGFRQLAGDIIVDAIAKEGSFAEDSN